MWVWAINRNDRDCAQLRKTDLPARKSIEGIIGRTGGGKPGTGIPEFVDFNKKNAQLPGYMGGPKVFDAFFAEQVIEMGKIFKKK